MKNQYFGDINDYLKYALLRTLSGRGELRTLVAWMLTPDDGGPDGRKPGYLQQPERYRHLDPEVFDFLAAASVDEHRGVKLLETAGLLPNSHFHTALIGDRQAARQEYFASLWMRYSDADWVFFDPDNGLEVSSCPSGRRGFSKYLGYAEVASAYQHGLSVLLYQHYPREPREPFITRTAERLRTTTGAPEATVFTTAHVSFFLLPQEHHRTALTERAASLSGAAGMLQVWKLGAGQTPGNESRRGRERPDPRDAKANGAIISEVVGLTAAQVVGQAVVCPSCREHTFKRWPLGWDAHAHRCAGLAAHAPDARKAEFRTRWRGLFR